MGKSPEARMSAVVMDGVLEKIPGFSAGLFGENLPFFINSPVMTLHTAQSNQGAFMVPFDATILAVLINVIEDPGTAAGTINVGTRANNDAFVDAYSVATDATLGLADITDNAAVVGTSITAGDVIEFDTGGEATTTGLIAVTLVCVPR